MKLYDSSLQKFVFSLYFMQWFYSILVADKAFSPYVDIVLIFFHVLVLLEYWVQTESRILLKPELGCVRIVALSISSHKQTQ